MPRSSDSVLHHSLSFVVFLRTLSFCDQDTSFMLQLLSNPSMLNLHVLWCIPL